MAYAQLKTDIAAVIRNNGNQEITGNVLQGALLEMINALGANYQYAGVADTSTTITTTEANVFYLLTEAGTYANMSSSIVHQSGIGIALWNGSAWSYQNVPTSALVPDGISFDVSAHNGGTTFASLDAILNSPSLSTLIPTDIRKGGMSIKFVLSSDNKYVKYFLAKDEWSVNVSDWQKLNLEEEVDEIIGGTFPQSPTMTWGFISNGSVNPSNSYKYSEPIHLNAGETIIVVTAGYSFDSISQTNASGTTYSRLVIGNSDRTTPKTYEYTASEDMYVAACCNVYYEWSISIEKKGKAPSREEFSDLSNLVGINTTMLQDKSEVITPTWNVGYRSSTDLRTISSENQRRSNPIPLTRGSLLRYSTPQGATSISMVTEVDASGNPIRMILKGLGGSVPNEVNFFATKDTYIEVCAYTSALANTSVIIYSSDSLKDVLTETPKSDNDINLGSLLWKERTTIDGANGQQVVNNYACSIWYGIPIAGINWLVLNKVEEDTTRTYTIRIAYYGDNDTYLGYKDYAIGETIRPVFAKYFKLALYTTLNGSQTGVIADANLSNLILTIRTSSTEYHYMGDRIAVCPKVSWKILANTSYNGRVQAGDCYGNILVQFHSQDYADYPLLGLEIIDLSTGEHLQQITLGYEEGLHNNGVSFGPNRYDPNDQFPLIYASVMFGTRDVYVYRLTESNGVYSITKVQTIHLLPLSAYNDLHPTCFVDKRGFLYSEGADASDTSVGIYIKYRLPQISEGADVQLTTDDVLDHFSLSVSDPFGGSTISGGDQDGTIIADKLYQIFGFAGSSWINCIDLGKKEIISSVSFQELTLNSEPEAVFLYSDMLGVSFNGLGGMIVGLNFNY